eukprot:CAMPEP_0184315148 /NCGR_PEP_ID=MMETSP1049-20130417/80410_1 /TAXON_ID=77928 /ORGANISM="Proteomonas sulcata, Strain CCMP704" /LENGTH=47 /DNA_ID= /DNA_START= /DNA_END= /DNA_ORIENTATION=
MAGIDRSGARSFTSGTNGTYHESSTNGHAHADNEMSSRSEGAQPHGQ